MSEVLHRWVLKERKTYRRGLYYKIYPRKTTNKNKQKY